MTLLQPTNSQTGGSNIQTLQKRVALPFWIIAGLGFIGFIIDIVLALRGNSPTWWIWTSGLIAWFGGSAVVGSIKGISPERFSKAMTVILYTMLGIFFGGGFIAFIIDIVQAFRGYSPAWWIWMITIGAMILGSIFAALLEQFESSG